MSPVSLVVHVFVEHTVEVDLHIPDAEYVGAYSNRKSEEFKELQQTLCATVSVEFIEQPRSPHVVAQLILKVLKLKF